MKNYMYIYVYAHVHMPIHICIYTHAYIYKCIFREVHIFPTNISLQVNVLKRLVFELDNSDIADQLLNHYAMGTQHRRILVSFYKLFSIALAIPLYVE